MVVSRSRSDQKVKREATSPDLSAIPSSQSLGMKRSYFDAFSFPSWGRTRIFRCLQVSGQSSSSLSPSDPSDLPRGSLPGTNDSLLWRDLKDVGGEEEGVNSMELKRKLVVQFDVAVDKIQKTATKEEKEAISPSVTTSKPAVEEVVKSRSFNLRKRRATSYALIVNGGKVEATSSPGTAEKTNGGNCVSKAKSVGFSLSLTKEEIEADFARMLLGRPSKKPKKRSVKEQKQLETLFPGMWLSEVSAEKYEVQKARRRR